VTGRDANRRRRPDGDHSQRGDRRKRDGRQPHGDRRQREPRTPARASDLPRQAAYDTLAAVHRDDAYANLVLPAILRDLRLGVYDVLVGINLLREGLDLPEVTLVAILDADKEGFLRSGGSLIQVIGRAARNIGGRVIMYADRVTDSMQAAIDETDRRRVKQVAYNTEHGIVPETITKEIRDIQQGLRRVAEQRAELQLEGKEPEELAEMMGRLEAQMREASRNLEFERAAALRDEILQLRRLREELQAAPGSIPAEVYAAAADGFDAGADGGAGRRERRQVFSAAATPNVIPAGTRRRPPRRRRP